MEPEVVPLSSSMAAASVPTTAVTNPTTMPFRDLVVTNHELAWRTLRRLGVEESNVDDAVQKVFLTVHAKLGQVAAGKERAFVVGVCSGIAANARRSQRRALRETELSEDLPASSKPGNASGETALDQRRARQYLDDALNTLTPELRLVFVLHELEGMTGPEIAECVEAPIGTVASRLRRARSLIVEQLAEIRGRFGGAP